MPETDSTNQEIVDAAARHVIEGLQAAEIDFIVLKGAAIARMLYLPGERRRYADFDLLVAPADRAAVAAILRAHGFVHDAERAGDADFLGVAHSEDWVRGDGAIVDVHWRLFGTRVPGEAVWPVLVSHSAELNLFGGVVRVLAPPALAAHLAIHAAQSGPLGAKALGDLERGLDRWPAKLWSAAADVARELDALDVFAAGLRLVPAGERLARQLHLPATPALSWMIENGEARPRGTFHLLRLTEARGLRAKLQVARRALLPSEAWLAAVTPGATRGGFRRGLAYARHMFVRVPSWTIAAWIYLRRSRRARGPDTDR